MTDVLLCVGNSMMGDDGAGPLLAEMCAANPVGDWVVIDGGSAPENDIVAIRELRPERLLIVVDGCRFYFNAACRAEFFHSVFGIKGYSRFGGTVRKRTH